MDYKESPLIGTTWQRCRAVTISNPHSSLKKSIQDPNGPPMTMKQVPMTPEVFFQEETAMALPDGRVLLQDVGSCREEFSAAGSFPLLNPATGEALGVTMSHQELYVALFSLYMATATARDAQP